MGEKLSAPGPGSSAGAADGDAEMVDPGYEPVTRLRSGHAAGPPSEPRTDARFVLPSHESVTPFRSDDAADSPSHPTTDARFALPKGGRASAQPVTQTALPRLPPSNAPVQPRLVPAPENLVRYGPGVHAAPSGAGVESEVARARRGGTPAPAQRRAWVGQVLGAALAVILLAASGMLFYARFHHPPLQVTRVTIVHSGRAGCTVTVAGQISTNGAAGMITYQWLFPVGLPLTRHQSVPADQHSVNVQVTVEGSGNGVASQRVWLQVLHPGRQIASKDILVTCS